MPSFYKNNGKGFYIFFLLFKILLLKQTKKLAKKQNNCTHFYTLVQIFIH